MPTSAACYLRSSKDRHDLSIDAQRRALHDYARDQGLVLERRQLAVELAIQKVQNGDAR